MIFVEHGALGSAHAQIRDLAARSRSGKGPSRCKSETFRILGVRTRNSSLGCDTSHQE